MPQENPAPLALEYIRALRDDRTLTTTEKLFAAVIASHAGQDGSNAHPGHVLLGFETSTSERTSKRTVSSLVEKGWLVQTSSGRGNSRYASVYALAVPQSAMGGTLDPEPTGQTKPAKVPNETGQSAISDSQGAIGGPTNQPVEITKEIPVSQISDDEVALTALPHELTGPASPDNEDDPGWTQYTAESLAAEIKKCISDVWTDRPGFEPRFVRRGVLDSLAALMNLHRVGVYDVLTGLFESHPAFGKADHDWHRIRDPARFLSRQLDGDLGAIIAYGERGLRISETEQREAMETERAEAAAKADTERAARELWESTEAIRAKILATTPEYVPARVHPLAGARFQTWLDAPGENFVSVCHNPEFDVAVTGHKLPGPDWIKGYVRCSLWDRIKDQAVIPLRQVA